MVTDSDWLHEQVSAARIAPVRFGAHTWLLDSRGVAYLAAHDTLVVSDLHLEKGSFLGSFGHPLPLFDSQATLDRLTRLLALYTPSTLICLGDSFHDGAAFERMQSAVKAQLQTMIDTVPRWIWILGNHDPAIPAALSGERHARLAISSTGFCHEPEDNWPGCDYQVVGHYHPKVRQRVGRQRVSGRCFALTPQMLMMPAFGQYTGGLWVDDPALQTLLPLSQRQCFVLQDERIFALGKARRASP